MHIVATHAHRRHPVVCLSSADMLYLPPAGLRSGRERLADATMAMRRSDAEADSRAATIRVSPDIAAWLVHRDYRSRPSRAWSLVEVGGPSLCLRLTVEEAEGLRDALDALLARVPATTVQPALIRLPHAAADVSPRRARRSPRQRSAA